MKMNLRTIKTGKVVETYITAVPDVDVPASQQAQQLFSGITEVLRSNKLQILQERVFGTSEALEISGPIRADAYGRLDDGVQPTWLVVGQGINGQIAGVQVHAVAGVENLEIMHLGELPCGRIVTVPCCTYLALSAISAPEVSQADQQATRMLEKAESLLKKARVDMFSVPRTWMWLRDILSWYDQFNDVRNTFFTERGLVGKDITSRMPASTGIGIAQACGSACVMDLVAVIQPADSIEYLDETGKQESAFDYGSAFSRAARAPTPAGTAVFVSGTASIGPTGATVHIDDPEAQIQATIDNVRAAVNQANCTDDQVVQALVYCKTAQIEKLFCDKWSDLPWPHITAITDICREDLLFEIEATAAVAH